MLAFGNHRPPSATRSCTQTGELAAQSMSHAARDSTNRPLTTAGGNCLPTTKSRAPKREQLLGPCHSVEEGKWRRPPTSPYPAYLHSEAARSLASPCSSLPTPPLPRARAQAPEYRGTSRNHSPASTTAYVHEPTNTPQASTAARCSRRRQIKGRNPYRAVRPLRSVTGECSLCHRRRIACSIAESVNAQSDGASSGSRVWK